MNRVNPLAARYYRLKSGHVPVRTYLKRFGHQDDDKCWWCGCGGRTVAPTWEHLFHHCSRWRFQDAMLWKKVGIATGWRACRCRHVQVSKLLSMEQCDSAVIQFLITTDIGKFLFKLSEE